ncbi:mpv17-like protein 2 [Dermatophagoides pteronyssinus]|uniref:mpv17-like protein 2 n=1 Tax=Dermatophagoides pteronyssinus TaxID=6956 RepID=UPI003F66C0A0
MLRNISRILYSSKYLFWTNTATGMIFFGTGDMIVQKYIDKRSNIDLNRNVNSCIAGTYMGSISHFWYGFLDRCFPGTNRKMIIKKLLSEAIVGPPFATTLFFIVGKLGHKSNQQIIDDIRENFKYLLMADWLFYIPLQFFNFYYLPTKYRVLYVSMLSLVYDSILVYVLHRNHDENFDSKQNKKN